MTTMALDGFGNPAGRSNIEPSIPMNLLPVPPREPVSQVAAFLRPPVTAVDMAHQ